ncbi:hypothetical protein [Nostoc sp.]|uniref:hypothetical protein n=1 Tax=Nostoc sp. TaxID=1180 RepID=UPI002FF868C6
MSATGYDARSPLASPLGRRLATASLSASLGFLSTRRSMRSLEWVGRSHLFHE